jgi:hypothetical protein
VDSPLENVFTVYDCLVLRIESLWSNIRGLEYINVDGTSNSKKSTRTAIRFIWYTQ